MTQDQLAEIVAERYPIKPDRSTISALEGGTKPIGPTWRKRLAAIFGMKPSDFEALPAWTADEVEDVMGKVLETKQFPRLDKLEAALDELQEEQRLIRGLLEELRDRGEPPGEER